RVLVLAGLADVRGLLIAVRHRVRRALTRLDRARPVEVAALADDGGLAGLDGLPLRGLAERALVVDRHDLHPRARELVPAIKHAGGHSRVGPPRMLLYQREDLVEVLVVHLLELDQLRVAAGRE